MFLVQHGDLLVQTQQLGGERHGKVRQWKIVKGIIIFLWDNQESKEGG